MDFLDRFSPRDRERLVAAASTQRVRKGEMLVRRGEKGGDIFRVVEGELEVVDTRSQPAIVLDVVGRGDIIGEMAFLQQEGVRAADVRAPEGAVCQRWERAQLVRMLDQEPLLAAGFYRVLAQMVIERLNAVTTSAVAGGIGGHAIPRGPTNEVAAADGHALASALRAKMMELEPLIRRDRAAAERDLGATLRNFTAALGEALDRMGDEDAAEAGRVVADELHPYIMRSHLGELALDRETGALAALGLFTHLNANRADGDGPLGEMLDAWLLALPTARGFRERGALALQAILDGLPADGPVRAAIVGAAGGIVPALLAQLRGRMAAEITCVDGDRPTLVAVENAVGARPRELRMRLVQEDLAVVCMGASKLRFAPQHLAVFDGVLEYLPEQVAARALGWARGIVAPGGRLIATALLPSSDDAVFRHVLGWPLVRRTAQSTARLAHGAGFTEVRTYEAAGTGLVVVAS